MTPLIQTPEDAARLREIAVTWIGTPWTADGAVKGTGAGCTSLPWACLDEFGHSAPTPPARTGVTKRMILPTILEWLGAHPEHYVKVEDHSDIRPGDILVFFVGIGHAALALCDGEMLHTWQTTGAHFSNIANGALSKRLFAVWRPIV